MDVVDFSALDALLSGREIYMTPYKLITEGLGLEIRCWGNPEGEAASRWYFVQADDLEKLLGGS